MKKFLAIFASVFVMLFGLISSSFADVYTMGSGALTGFDSAAEDVADSLVGAISSLLPLAVPLLVVGFIIGMIMSFVRKRG